jgi:hypothetical protein
MNEHRGDFRAFRRSGVCVSYGSCDSYVRFKRLLNCRSISRGISERLTTRRETYRLQSHCDILLK